MGTALYFDIRVPNLGIQKCIFHTNETDEISPHERAPGTGRLRVGGTSGHEEGLDERRAATCPSPPKQLPVARLEGGAMWDW